jgi:hypothetical protein
LSDGRDEDISRCGGASFCLVCNDYPAPVWRDSDTVQMDTDFLVEQDFFLSPCGCLEIEDD